MLMGKCGHIFAYYLVHDHAEGGGFTGTVGPKKAVDTAAWDTYDQIDSMNFVKRFIYLIKKYRVHGHQILDAYFSVYCFGKLDAVNKIT